jgi:hypothetical protein
MITSLLWIADAGGDAYEEEPKPKRVKMASHRCPHTTCKRSRVCEGFTDSQKLSQSRENSASATVQ